jgi:uncharacterized protein YdhG (YjbR/CyaY superfamily)
MKRRESVKRPAAKGRAAPKNVDEYFAEVSEPVRSNLSKLRAAIRAASPRGAAETISYRIPAFKYKGGLVWYAGFAHHCSLFPTASVIEAFRSELKSFPTSKGTIQFPADEPLPIALIKKIVRERFRQLEGKKRL